ncbi:AGAP001041-PA-like protein [Anopheles sinensis]|uniref:E3 ubiquitin-protein ligase MARCHF5 n=1 Tax=Anopheles sinensis TaxID=74873 RepID=A0A084WF30_ANOSI|nr:AGAP001041-PA-like protein [Anopheles sinensis]
MLSDELESGATDEQQGTSDEQGQPLPINSSSTATERVNQSSAATDEQEERYCWVCFATEEDDKFAPWVQPCNCRGATKWVHQSCLKRWIDEKQKGNPYKSISCPQCQTEYIIILPSMGSFAFMLERLDIIAKQLSPCVAAGAIVCSIYWSAITFGAVTVLQTTGFERGLLILEQAEPLALLVCLPAIPAALVLGRMIRWEDMVLRMLQNTQYNIRKYPVISFMLPVTNEPTPSYPEPFPNNSINASEPLSVTRIFCGALMLPTVSTIVGKMFFKSIKNDLHRTLLGGFAFVAIKGVLKIYFHQKKHNRAKQRNILDYTQENIRKYGFRSQHLQQLQQQHQHLHQMANERAAQQPQAIANVGDEAGSGDNQRPRP